MLWFDLWSEYLLKVLNLGVIVVVASPREIANGGGRLEVESLSCCCGWYIFGLWKDAWLI